MNTLTATTAKNACNTSSRVTLSAMLNVYRQRHALSRLSDDALRDIGLTREEANAEARRMPWDLPSKICK